MAAFSNTAFSTSAFSVGAFDFGSGPTPPPAPVVVPPLVGGGFTYEYRRPRKSLAKDRERFGIPNIERQVAEALVEDIAARQAKSLERDEQKRFEELQRELQIRGIQWQAQYLESMNAKRERLIEEEIATIFQQRQDEETMLLMIAALV